MRTKFPTFALIILGATIMSCNQHEPEKKVEKTQEEYNDSQKELKSEQEQYNSDYQKYKLDMENKILDNEKEINKLKEKRINVKESKRGKYDDDIRQLEIKNDELRSRMSTYQDEGKEKWESFKNEFNHDMDELGHSIKDLFKDNVKD